MKYGFIKDEIKEQDHIFGSGAVPFEVIRPDGDWTDDLPIKEIQNLNQIEPYACVIFTLLNCVETLIYAKYNLVRNYSDRFLATVVDTKGGGCSPQRACEFLRKIGVVPQDIWPFDATVDTEDKFFQKLAPKLYEIALDFKKEWEFLHDYVKPITDENISNALKSSPLMISVPAWSQNDQGKYYRPEGATDNHATTLFCQRPGEFRRVFDSYDNPYIKDIEWSCTPEMVKRFSLKRKNVYDYKPSGNWLSQILKSTSTVIIDWLFPKKP